jgi:glycosyltransferase involved in cell wall biosynthesis
VRRKSGDPVKVCHVATIDDSIQVLLLNQLLSIQADGYEVVAISSAGPYVPNIEACGIRHIAVPMKRQVRPFADLLSLWRLYRAMRREGFTIVHTHNPKPGLLGQIAARLAGVPMVVNTVHGFYFGDHMKPFTRWFFIQMEKIAACCSTSILSQNQEDIRTAIEKRICKTGLIKHLGNGIDLTLFDPARIDQAEHRQKRSELGIDERAPIVGFVGRLAHRKGFIDYLKAAEIVLEEFPDARFLVIGEADAGKSDALQPDVVSEYDLGNSCIFLGRQASDDLPLLYTLMNLLVLPSPFEGVPRVVMEACAMGVPSVVTDVKGNREVIREGENGYLVPYGAPADLAKAISRVLQDPQHARRMGARGREIALEEFDELRVFDRVKAEYRTLLARSHFAESTT